MVKECKNVKKTKNQRKKITRTAQVQNGKGNRLVANQFWETGNVIFLHTPFGIFGFHLYLNDDSQCNN